MAKCTSRHPQIVTFLVYIFSHYSRTYDAVVIKVSGQRSERKNECDGVRKIRDTYCTMGEGNNYTVLYGNACYVL